MFVFPYDLDLLTADRLSLPDVPEGYLENAGYFRERCSEIRFKDELTMQFSLDGRNSVKCVLSVAEAGWMATGRLQALDIACHHAAARNAKSVQVPKQRILFD